MHTSIDAEIIVPILQTEIRDAALILTMNRPQALNALSTALVQDLLSEMRAADTDRGVRAVIIAAAGDRAFSAGTDLKERAMLTTEERAAQSRSLLTLSEVIWTSSKPVIAAVHGWCLGGGSELALACDLRIAADDARFGFPEMTLGAYPGSGGPVTLTRLVGPSRAKEILFTARRFDAAEALALGIVQRVVSRDELLAAALEWVAQMSATSPLALAALKQSINRGMTLSLQDAAELDQGLRRPLDATRDYAEGMRAHFEKRKPHFIGE